MAFAGNEHTPQTHPTVTRSQFCHIFFIYFPSILSHFFLSPFLLKGFKANSKYHIISPLYTSAYISGFMNIKKFNHSTLIITTQLTKNKSLVSKMSFNFFLYL